MPHILDEILLPDRHAQLVDDGIYSTGTVRGTADGYDAIARIYDLVIGNPLYNRIMWGTWPSSYSSRCQATFDGLPPGPVLDAGCGSLVFTAGTYAKLDRPLVLVDGSIGMLRKARSRLEARCGGLPPHVTFLQADFLDLPFRPGAFAAAMSWGTLHLVDDPGRLISELRRVTRSDGRVASSSLTLVGRSRGDSYLYRLHKAGHVNSPRRPEEVVALTGLTPAEITLAQSGSMTFLSAHGGLPPSSV